MADNKEDQLSLDLRLDVATIKKINGIQMGVFDDGTPFMTEHGLARVAGISQGTLNALGQQYGSPNGGERLREMKIAKTLANKGFEAKRLYEKILVDGVETNAYYGVVCMAIVKYYAFQAGRFCNEIAERNYDVLADKSFKDFVYQMVGYKPADPDAAERQSWQNLRTRIALNSMPIGYFSVLEESYPLELKIIRHGLIFDQHTVPDISIGGTWGRRWTQNKFDEKYGKRIKHPHVYPDSYAQSKFNGKHDYWVYPIEAIGEFKKWLQIEYAAVKLPKYLKDKVKAGVLQASDAQVLLNAVNPPQLRSAS